jgi:uncharacterized DUF497 family protein
VRITFDPAKRDRTLVERGLDFLWASDVFEGLHLTFPDDRFDYGESASSLLGDGAEGCWSLSGRRGAGTDM